MKYFLLLSLVTTMACFEASAKSWDGKIYNVRNQIEISEPEYIQELSNYSIIVLGEKHYTTAVQLAEAKTIREVVLSKNKVGSFTTGWEFLNITSQNMTNSLFAKVKNSEITSEEFLIETQGKTPTSSYAPVIDVTAELGGNLLGMNLSRAEKDPVTKNGIEAIDPKLLPPGFDYGTPGYFERFQEIMQGHATPEQVNNYYASQCVVDDVMAYHLLKDSNQELKFLIAGSFHTDFYDGAVNRMKVRNNQLSLATVKIVDASDYSENELMEVLHDDKYGDVADYIYFVNSPK